LSETQPAVRASDAAEPPRSIFRSPFVWAFFAGIVLLTLIRPLLRHEPAPPQVLGQLPAFSLTAMDGKPFGSAELAGEVYVADFIFTRCVSICPRLTASMALLARRYDESGLPVRLLSITVDPEHDTPERLAAYAAEHGLDARRWTLLTGSPEQITRVVRDGFRVPLGQPDTAGGIVDIAHTGKFVLVDGQGRIRGYYDSDELGLDEIFHRSRHVLDEGGGP
jgi:protein SCO1/2